MRDFRLLKIVNVVFFFFFLIVLIISFINSDFSSLSLTGYSIYPFKEKSSIDEKVVLFFEGFEFGGVNNWMINSGNVDGRWASSNKEPNNGNYFAYSIPNSKQNSSIQKTFNTKGYEKIVLSYNRKLIGLDKDDYFYSLWNDGEKWNVLEVVNYATDENYVEKSFSLSSLADDNLNIEVKFICSAGANLEECMLDDIFLYGENIKKL